MSAALGLGGIAVGWVAGPQILAVFYGPEYARHSDVLNWLVAAAALSFIFGIQGTSLTALRCFRLQALLHMMSAVVSVPLFYYFTRSFGLVGAAGALFIQALLMILAYGCAEARARARSSVGQTACSGELPAA